MIEASEAFKTEKENISSSVPWFADVAASSFPHLRLDATSSNMFTWWCVTVSMRIPEWRIPTHLETVQVVKAA